MPGVIDRYVPSDPVYRLCIAFVAPAVLLTALLWSSVYVLNMYETIEALQSIWWVVILALLVCVIGSFQFANVLLGDIARRARAATARPSTDGSTNGPTAADADEESLDPIDRIRRRYAHGELTEAELERRIDRIMESDQRCETATDAATERVVE